MTLFSGGDIEISGKGMISTQPNVFGGQNIMNNGRQVVEMSINVQSKNTQNF